MDYAAALDFLLGRTDYERWPGYQYAGRFDLRRTEYLLERLGNPHLDARSVHIAGSKGKGSTAAMIAAGLHAAGWKTGLYTSPHLVTLRERISVGGKSILKSELGRVADIMRPVVEEMDRDRPYGELSTFELLTAAAFLQFRLERVDFQVLETGLGGRLDATNVVTPEVCVITSISLDHTEVLGHTLAEIAGEKAGIIKPGKPVVSSHQAEEAASVIKATCRERDNRLILVGRDVAWRELRSDLYGQSLEVDGLAHTYRLTIPLLGRHQLENAAAAVGALEILGTSRRSIEDGLANTRWPGRLQILKRRPVLVVDGAHSRDSARTLIEALPHYFHFRHLIFIIGTSADKDMSGIVAELAPRADRVIVTRSRHPRAMDPVAIAREVERHGAQVEIAHEVSQALRRAREEAGRRDLICATGSLFLVGEVIEHVKGLRPELYSS